jgi:hypothetical protein
MSNASTTCFVALVVHGGLLQLAVQLRLLSRSWPVLELERRVVFSHVAHQSAEVDADVLRHAGRAGHRIHFRRVEVGVAIETVG